MDSPPPFPPARSTHRPRRTRYGRRTTAGGSTAAANGWPPPSRSAALATTTSQTADGIPYWQIALLHLDSLASTVIQTCAYWGNSDQCTFCGIGVTLANGRTIAKKTPEMLAEVAVAAKELDGAVDATLTTGTTATPDKGALYVARCAAAVHEASRLPVEVQFEPPRDLAVIDQVADLGVDRSASTSRPSIRRCWRGSRPPRRAPGSTPTSGPGSGPWPRSGRARYPPT